MVQEGRTAEEVAAHIRDAAFSWLKNGPPDLAIVFATAHFAAEHGGLLKDLRACLKPRRLVGGSGRGVNLAVCQQSRKPIH